MKNRSRSPGLEKEDSSNNDEYVHDQKKRGHSTDVDEKICFSFVFGSYFACVSLYRFPMVLAQTQAP